MYYIVNKENGETLSTNLTPFNIDPNVQPEDDSIVQLKHVEDETVPIYNKSSHKLVRTSVDNFVNFTRTFKLVAEELTEEDKASIKISAQERNFNNVLRIQLSSGNGTLEERVARLETILLNRGF